MASYKVYKPYSKNEGVIIDAQKETDIPNYPDSGISYAGFSKIRRGNNDYELKPQIPADINFFYTFVFGETSITLNRVNQTEKDFYCNKIVLNYHNNAAVIGSVVYWYLRAGSGGQILLSLQENPTEYWELNLDFKTPLKFPKGTPIYLEFSRARGANETMGLNFYGWEE